MRYRHSMTWIASAYLALLRSTIATPVGIKSPCRFPGTNCAGRLAGTFHDPRFHCLKLKLVFYAPTSCYHWSDTNLPAEMHKRQWEDSHTSFTIKVLGSVFSSCRFSLNLPEEIPSYIIYYSTMTCVFSATYILSLLSSPADP